MEKPEAAWSGGETRELGSRLCHVLVMCPLVSLCPSFVTVARSAAVGIKVTAYAES